MVTPRRIELRFRAWGARVLGRYATSNHYGIIQLYNQRIDSNTTDEEIIKIRSAYLSWKNDIIAILAEYNLFFEDDKFCELFSIDSMSGRLSFLDEEVDIYQSADVYRKIIKRMLNLIDHVSLLVVWVVVPVPVLLRLLQNVAKKQEY